MGIRMMHTAEVNFKDVRVPLNNLIGKENKGFYQVLEFFDESRILIAAQALGTAQGGIRSRPGLRQVQGSSSAARSPSFKSPSTNWPTWPPPNRNGASVDL